MQSLLWTTRWSSESEYRYKLKGTHAEYIEDPNFYNRYPFIHLFIHLFIYDAHTLRNEGRSFSDSGNKNCCLAKPNLSQQFDLNQCCCTAVNSCTSCCSRTSCASWSSCTSCISSPFSCGCVLAMIHLTRQHLIKAFREKRGFCHFPESFARPGAGSTPLGSPSRPSTTLPSAWRETRSSSVRVSMQFQRRV